MASPAHTRTLRPLDGMRLTAGGPAPLTGPAVAHLRMLGAAPGPDADQGHPELRLTGAEFTPVAAEAQWSAGPAAGARGIVDEATAQAATGIMAVHGRRDGAPRGLAVDYTATTTAVLTVQGLLAALLAQARGGRAERVRTYAGRAGLLAVSQYLAAAGAEDGEAVDVAPGGPPFTSAEGTRFELETLDPGAWADFWRELGATPAALRAGWRPFQFRYATASAPFPAELHEVTRRTPWARIRSAAEVSGAQVCALRTLAERAAERTAEGDGVAPWTLETAAEPGRPGGRGLPPTGGPGAPLAGLTVLEAGRRIQAPLAAHLLGLLGAEVIRIEPPGGDPLRGMPPSCSGISARWLALNRGKRAVEIDIKSPAGRDRLRELSADADVLLHNWAPGKATELGLERGDLARGNPALVYAYTGGWAGRMPGAPMGTDFMVQARTGVGEAVRPADEPPAPSLMTLLDVLGGLLGAEAVLAALLLRERTGRGVRAESSLLAASDALTAPALHRIATGCGPRRAAGFRRPLPTADGWVAPADGYAAEAEPVAGELLRLSAEDAASRLRDRHGVPATPVITDLAVLPDDPRFAGVIRRDALGSLAVPDPWSIA